jgi:hypothetical protein
LELSHRQLTITTAGVLGLIAAILVGAGEFMLHFDALGRFAEGGAYEFMRGINAERTTIGHFLSVLSAPFYIIGFWHIMKMLEPANILASRIAFAIVTYGVIVGAVWIGSRAAISAIINSTSVADPTSYILLYELRYENLLQLTRIAVLVFSVIFIWLVLTGNSHYPRWMALLNPVCLILASFVIWLVAPAIGIYIMPIALNISFALLFMFSTYYSNKIKE